MQSALAEAAPKDSDILELLHRGVCDEAFTQLLDRYEYKLYRLCCTLQRDPTLAQDAAQESLVRIWKALPSFDGRASLSTWIYTITRNRCLTALAQRREQAAMIELEAEMEWVSVEDAEPSDRSRLLRELVERLPERYRRTLTLYYYEDHSISEVAAMLVMPEGTVKTTLHRARAALMEQLQRRGLDSPGMWLETCK